MPLSEDWRIAINSTAWLITRGDGAFSRRVLNQGIPVVILLFICNVICELKSKTTYFSTHISSRKLGAWPHLSAPLLVWKIRERIEHKNNATQALLTHAYPCVSASCRHMRLTCVYDFMNSSWEKQGRTPDEKKKYIGIIKLEVLLNNFSVFIKFLPYFPY